MAINDVIFKHRGIDHEDERRALFTAFNGDVGGFVAQQVKFAEMKRDAILGGHYHEYDELFYMLKGEGSFNLKDVDCSDRLVESYDMVQGDMLLIPQRIAHRAEIKSKSILVGCTAEPYVFGESDHKYDF